ncbi:MAG TPA: DUF4080 domain-containing protein [Oscillospiraceae bacterium]|nr:DUF4080 domain-containing protein [Oscillospiraceae bacterium]
MESKFRSAVCSLNSKFVHSSLAAWYLAAAVKETCGDMVSCKVIEGTINESSDVLLERLSQEMPDLLGFSCYIWNITKIMELAPELKRRFPTVKFVLGGPEVSYRAADLLRSFPWIDYVLSGEGELPFAKLAEALSRGEDPENIPGLCFRKADGIVETSPFLPNTEPPCPYSEDYFRALNGRIAYLETSRGCPFSCAFCLSGRCGGVRFFPIARAKREILFLANSGTQTVKLVDRTFNANRERAMELWRFVIEQHGVGIPEGVCFHFEIAGDLLDDEEIALLGTAPKGSIQLEIGLQSFNRQTLAAVTRKTDLEKLQKNILALLAPRNIHIHIDLIAGLPYEDLPSFIDSFNRAFSLRPDMLQLGFLKLLPGAPMRENPVDYPCRFHRHPPYEVTETPWMSERALQSLHRTEDALERLYNSGRFRRTVDYLLAETDEVDAYGLFRCFGEEMAGRDLTNIPLDDFTELACAYFSGLPGADPDRLKDAMLIDRLSTISGGKLPEFLKKKDPDIKKIRREIEQRPGLEQKVGVRRGFALFFSEKKAAVVDYTGKDPVTGEYPVTVVPYE